METQDIITKEDLDRVIPTGFKTMISAKGPEYYVPISRRELERILEHHHILLVSSLSYRAKSIAFEIKTVNV